MIISTPLRCWNLTMGAVTPVRYMAIPVWPQGHTLCRYVHTLMYAVFSLHVCIVAHPTYWLHLPEYVPGGNKGTKDRAGRDFLSGRRDTWIGVSNLSPPLEIIHHIGLPSPRTCFHPHSPKITRFSKFPFVQQDNLPRQRNAR